MRVREVLRSSAAWCTRRGIPSPRLEAEVLLAHALGIERIGLYLDGERPLVEAELEAYRRLLRRRAAGEPSAYLTGRREFYGLAMRVTPAVLVPRPETELLVDRARELAPDSLLDLCTGSGCIAVACAKRLPACRITATDLCADALAIARENAERHGVADRIAFHEGDLFSALPAPHPYDLIVSNPPYVADGTRPEIVAHEPSRALYAGPDGTDLLRRILAEAPRWLAPGGTLLCEIGEDQEGLAGAAAHFREVIVRRDLAGLPRVLEAR